MDFVREEGGVRLFLEWRADDGEQPRRRLYWLCAEAPTPAWSALFEPGTVEGWMRIAVPAEFPGGDRRVWRQTSRYAVVRRREQPAALGVNAPLVPDVLWSRV